MVLMVMVQRASDEMATEVELRALARDVSTKNPLSVSLYVVFTFVFPWPSFLFQFLLCVFFFS